MRFLKKSAAEERQKERYYNFELTGRYFYNLTARRSFRHTIDEATANDLDLNDVFIRIDHTSTRIGEQYFYAKGNFCGSTAWYRFSRQTRN